MGTLVFALFLHSQLVQLVILYIIAPTPSLLTRSRSFTPLHSLNSRYFSHKIPFAKMYKFLILAASAAFASAYTPPTTQCTDGCNPIAKPGLNEVVPAGTEYTITWQPTTAGTVSIVLLKGPSENILPLYAVAEKIANTGTYSWTPAADLEPTGNSGYGFQLINDADGTYQWSTQFGIANNGYSGAGSASGSASPSASASATAASNGTISSSAAPTVSHPIGFSNSTASLPLRLTPRLPFPLRPAQLVFPQPRQSLLNPPTVPLLSVSVSKTAVEVGGVSFSLSLANSVVEGVSGDGIDSGSGCQRNLSGGLLFGEKGSSDKAGNLMDGALESSVISGDGFVSSNSDGGGSDGGDGSDGGGSVGHDGGGDDGGGIAEAMKAISTPM